MTRAGSPHSDTLGSQPASRLPEAYRRPPRPSSAPDAKASTERPKKQNTNPTKDKQHHRPHPHTTRRGRGPRHTKNKDTRVHYTDHNQPTHRSTHQHTTSRTPHRPHQGAPPQNPTAHPPPNPPNKKGGPGQDAPPHHTHAPQTPRRPQQPPRTRAHAAGTARRVPCTTNPAPHRRQTPRSTTPPENRPPAYGRQRPCPPASPSRKIKLPRKEVIQPHLPVRLPCYDFVPITSPTFDRSPQGHGLRVSPAFMT